MPPRGTDIRKDARDGDEEQHRARSRSPLETQSPSSSSSGGGGGGDSSRGSDHRGERGDSGSGTNPADRSERPALQSLSKDGANYTPGPKKEQNQTPSDANATGKDGQPKKFDPPSSKDKPPDGKNPDAPKYQKAPDKPSHPGKVSFANPLGGHAYGPGRGATGPGSHGADKGGGKDWQTRSAQDLHAKPGTAVFSPVAGKVTEVYRDQRDQKTGKIYGDQVTITTPNGEMKVFMTHMTANQDVQVGKEVKQGEQIGKVSQWDSNPGGEHLHVGMAVAGQDGSYQGADPTGALDATRGTGQAKDVDVPGDGSYSVGEGASRVEYRPNDDTAPARGGEPRPSDRTDYGGSRDPYIPQH